MSERSHAYAPVSECSRTRPRARMRMIIICIRAVDGATDQMPIPIKRRSFGVLRLTVALCHQRHTVPEVDAWRKSIHDNELRRWHAWHASRYMVGCEADRHTRRDRLATAPAANRPHTRGRKHGARYRGARVEHGPAHESEASDDAGTASTQQYARAPEGQESNPRHSFCRDRAAGRKGKVCRDSQRSPTTLPERILLGGGQVRRERRETSSDSASEEVTSRGVVCRFDSGTRFAMNEA